MKEFNALPTEKRVQDLTDEQIYWIIENMTEDNRIAALQAKGISPDESYYDTSYEDEVWNKPEGEWEILGEDDDPDDIARQVAAMTNMEDRERLKEKLDNMDEYSEYIANGGKTDRQAEVEQYINNQLQKALEMAQAREKGIDIPVDDSNNPTSNQMTDLDKEAMEEAIKLFNEEDDDFDDL